MGGRGLSAKKAESNEPILKFVSGHDSFFGDYQNFSNKYFVFDHIIDDDNFIIITKQIFQTFYSIEEKTALTVWKRLPKAKMV